MADATPPDPAPPGGRVGLWDVFLYTADRDKLLIPTIVAAELVATALTGLMVVLWHPLFVIIGLLLAVVAPLVALHIRLRRLAQDEAGSADLP
jgi:hypothetical protein